MTLFRQYHLGLATVIVSMILGLSSTGEGYKQELWLYNEDGIALYFQSHVPNLYDYSSFLLKITRYCWKGVWLFSSGINYKTYLQYSGSSDDNSGKERNCGYFNITTVKSLRHFAANETATDAISLYSGTDWEGEEVYVTKVKTDISITIGSVAASGTADWMVYEGKNFDGKSRCYEVPYNQEVFNWDRVQRDFNMTTIGSVFKGCDLYEIQVYKESLIL